MCSPPSNPLESEELVRALFHFLADVSAETELDWGGLEMGLQLVYSDSVIEQQRGEDQVEVEEGACLVARLPDSKNRSWSAKERQLD